MSWITPIYDRTEADVEYARLNRGGPHVKGALNFTDRARIAGNIHFLADMLNDYGYGMTVYCDTDWPREKKPTHAQVTVIYQDIERLQQGFARVAHCPILSWNTYQKINEIERILYELHEMIGRMAASINLGWALGIAHIGLYGGIA